MQDIYPSTWTAQGNSMVASSHTVRVRSSAGSRRNKLTSLLRASAFVLVATLGFAQNPKIASSLETLDQNAIVDVIVQYDHLPSAADHQRVLSRGGALRREGYK